LNSSPGDGDRVQFLGAWVNCGLASQAKAFWDSGELLAGKNDDHKFTKNV